MASLTRTIADQVAEFRQNRAAPAAAAFTEEHAVLDADGLPPEVATVGSAMPDGELLDEHGESTTLAQTRRGRLIVVVFYRGAWCPFCNIALRNYQDHLVGHLDRRGVALIAISPQKPDEASDMRGATSLTYTVLSDPANQIAGGLGILTTPTDAVRSVHAERGLDVAATNADGTDTLPMPTVVIVDEGGTIRWIDVHPNYTTRTESAQIVEALDRILPLRTP